MTIRDAIGLAMAIIVLAGCIGTRGLRDDEADIAIWYVEDLSHGNPRLPGEIRLVDGSEAMADVARLLAGSEQNGEVMPPHMLSARQQRWPSLKALFRSGFAVVVVDGPHRGLVAPSKDLSGTDLAMAIPIIDAENNDRRTLDALIISTAQYDASRQRRFRAAAANVRVALDTAAGAKPWTGATY